MRLFILAILFFNFYAQAFVFLKPEANSLSEAVYNDDIQKVKTLIENGADANVFDGVEANI